MYFCSSRLLAVSGAVKVVRHGRPVSPECSAKCVCSQLITSGRALSVSSSAHTDKKVADVACMTAWLIGGTTAMQWTGYTPLYRWQNIHAEVEKTANAYQGTKYQRLGRNSYSPMKGQLLNGRVQCPPPLTTRRGKIWAGVGIFQGSRQAYKS